MHIYSMNLKSVREEAPAIQTFLFDIPDGLQWTEGAHIHLAFSSFNTGDQPNRSRVRHMSIASLQEEEHVAITTRLYESSSFKADMMKLRPGDSMSLFKVGNRLELRHENRPLYLLSMGVGLAAFRPLILTYQQDPTNIPSLTSITTARNGYECYYSELSPLTNGPARQIYVPSSAAYYEQLQDVPSDGIYYVVGSNDFVNNTIRALFDRGISADNIILDMHDDKRDYHLGIVAGTIPLY